MNSVDGRGSIRLTAPTYTADMIDEQRASRNYYDYYNKRPSRVKPGCINPSNSSSADNRMMRLVAPNAAVTQGCSYVNSLSSAPPANTASPIQFISYGSYVGAQDRDRLTPNYADKLPAGSCNGPNVCLRFVG